VIVVPLPPTAPGPAGSTAASTTRSPATRLRLVPAHAHTWELRAVDFDEGLEVRRYECSDCEDVQFR
jgi:hypothetical protein